MVFTKGLGMFQAQTDAGPTFGATNINLDPLAAIGDLGVW
jgi:hypothetical protein